MQLIARNRSRRPQSYVFALLTSLATVGMPGLASVQIQDNDLHLEVEPPVRRLIITTQGGSGHLQAAERVKQDLRRAGLGYAVIDVVKEKYMQAFVNLGQFGVTRWNHASRKGHIRRMDNLAEYQWLAEWCFGRNFRKRIFEELARYPEVVEVIDTQPLNTDQILSAVYHYNEITHDAARCAAYNRNHKSSSVRQEAGESYLRCRESGEGVVGYRKILTDLPTEEARHFLGSIKRIKPEHVKYFTLETPAYPRDNAEGDKTLAYFRKIAPQVFQGRERNPLKITHGPIRHGFMQFIDEPADKDEPLSIKVGNDEEYNVIREAIGEVGGPLAQPLAGEYLLAVGRQASVHSIMLGSQIPEKHMFAYINAEVESYRELGPAAAPLFLFVFTGARDSQHPLFQKIVQLVRDERAAGTWPEGMHIVPLSLQSDAMIGRLYSLADRIVIRSGGLSAMEVEAVSRGKVFIHSAFEKEDMDLSSDLIQRGMPTWEWGNALHMLETLRYEDGSRRAYIVNPILYGRLLKMLAGQVSS